MILSIIPKLPMRNKQITKAYYLQLGFKDIGTHDYPNYLLMELDSAEIHFFLHEQLEVAMNDGQVYIRVEQIEKVYQSLLDNGVAIHPQGALKQQPWGTYEFSLLDPDHNLLTFGSTA